MDPVVTDADLVLGRINGERFLNGAMRLDIGAARRAIDMMVGNPLGLPTMEAALGVATISDANMSLSVRAVSVNKGVDPRDTAMIAFGGAGPLHAIAIAREIFIPQVIIPKLPGNFSALGMLMASWRQDLVRTLVGRLGYIDKALVEQASGDLARNGKSQMQRDGILGEIADFRFYADMRYVGQEHALPIRIESVDALTGDTALVRKAFHEEHDTRYGQAAVEEELEIVNLRLVITASRSDTLAEQWLTEPWTPTDNVQQTSRDVVYDDPDKPLRTQVLWRPSMPAGMTITGPAVIEEPNSTILIHPGDKVTVTHAGHLIIDIAPKD
jgi:N-methylhydantoinase A